MSTAKSRRKSDAYLSKDAAVDAVQLLLRYLVKRTPSRITQVEPWTRIEDAARHAAVNEDTVRKWISRGQLAAGKCGGVLRVRLSDVDALLLRAEAPKKTAKPTSFTRRIVDSIVGEDRG